MQLSHGDIKTLQVIVIQFSGHVYDHASSKQSYNPCITMCQSSNYRPKNKNMLLSKNEVRPDL